MTADTNFGCRLEDYFCLSLQVMTMPIHRPDIYDIMKAAVADGLEIAQQSQSGNKYVRRHYDFPTISFYDSGFPSFSTKFLTDQGTPKDYSSIFYAKNPADEFEFRIDPSTIGSWRRFWDLAIHDDRMGKYLEIQDSDANGQDIEHHPDYFNHHRVFYIFGAIGRLVDGYIHVHNSFDFDEIKFLPLYQEWENAIFLDDLEFEIVIPLLCLAVADDSIRISKNARIERMDESFQLARSRKRSVTAAPHELVTGAATHALVLEGWSIQNCTYIYRMRTCGDIRAFADLLNIIDIYFASLRTVSAIDTGYAQLIAKPIGWGDHWKAGLPQLYSVSARRYPDSLEQFGWLRTPTPLSKANCEEIGQLAYKLMQTPRLSIAVKRLNAAFLRQTEEDSILDVTMALESILTSDSMTEITHRLAMRVAALCKLDPFEDYDAERVFWLCKRIYDYRSAVVHGGKDLEKKRVLQPHKDRYIYAIRTGINLLRHIIKFMSNNTKYLAHADELDKYLLSGKTDDESKSQDSTEPATHPGA